MWNKKLIENIQDYPTDIKQDDHLQFFKTQKMMMNNKIQCDNKIVLTYYFSI